MNNGIKESEGKLNIEYDWDFLKAQMIRMAKNKHKYPKYNWKKPMDIEELKDALFRHTLEIMNNNFEDDGDEFGHLSAISLNAMMIFNQLNSKKDSKTETNLDILENFVENQEYNFLNKDLLDFANKVLDKIKKLKNDQ